MLASAAATAALALSALLGRRWLATGFDEDYTRAIGMRSPLPDAILLVLVALSAVVSVSAVGALLVTALFVVPPATIRLFTRRLLTLQIGSIALAAVEGIAGIWLSVKWNAPPGAAIAVLSGGCFALAALARILRQRRAVLVPALAVLLLATAGCGGGGGNSESGRIEAVATTTQIGDWARRVGGTSVDVHQILQPNTDPHDYEPRPADVVATANANVVFENGDELDHWMAKVVSEAGGSPTVVVLGEAVPVKRPGETSGSEASRHDPHWWHDPRDADRRCGPDSRHIRDDRRRTRRYVPAQRRRLHRAASSSRPGNPGLHASGPANRSASSSPTTTRLATSRIAMALRSSAR